MARDLCDTSVPIAEEDGDGEEIKEFNKLYLNRGPLKLRVNAEFGAITCARACVFLACIDGEGPCTFESISKNGKMDRTKIVKQCPWIADPLDNGIEFLIIRRKAKMLYPHLAQRLQHAFIDQSANVRIPQLALLFELLELGRTPHNTWETAKAQVAHMTGDTSKYKADIEHMATFASECLNLRGVFLGDVLSPVIKYFVKAAHTRRVVGNFWKALAAVRGPSTTASEGLPFLATAMLSAQIACGDTYIQSGFCVQLQPRHVNDVMRDKAGAFTWDRQIETALSIALQLKLPDSYLGECIGRLFIKTGRIAANVHRDSDRRHDPRTADGNVATIDGVCWECVETANYMRSVRSGLPNPFKRERYGLADEPVCNNSATPPSAVAREGADVTPIENGCFVQHTDGTTWQVIEAIAGTEISGGADGRLVLEKVLPTGLTRDDVTCSCSTSELSSYHKVATVADNFREPAEHSEMLQLALGTSIIVLALRIGMCDYPHPQTRIESLPFPKVISCADYPTGTMRMVFASARVEPVDSWRDTDVVCHMSTGSWGVVDGYRYKIVPMSDRLFKCDAWRVNTVPIEELANMEKQTLEVEVTSRLMLPWSGPPSSSRVRIPVLTNTKDIKAGDRLYCKSTIGIPCNLDTGDAPRATLAVPSESAASSSRPSPNDSPFIQWVKRRRID